MNIKDFLAQPDAPAPIWVASRLPGVRSDATVRAWARGDSVPSPRLAMSLWVLTAGKVPPWADHPDDWWLIWPMLVSRPDAPPLPPGADLSTVMPPEPAVAAA